MQPFFYDIRASQRWKTEEDFIKYLEKGGGVDWWFKNGDRDATYFAVPYTEAGIDMPFYVDFIAKLFLLSTKSVFSTTRVCVLSGLVPINISDSIA